MFLIILNLGDFISPEASTSAIAVSSHEVSIAKTFIAVIIMDILTFAKGR